MDWSRLKNYGLWVAILALIPLILKQFGIYIIPEEYTQITTAILSILVLAGILNNPTTENKGFLDDNIKNKKEIE
ncbi:phage holin [Clostridium thermobutyricum]|uniref:Bacteriophage holin n=1 Tax=Clostridium thermobutyricum DSM 4928 TaxID=1121339 RepID=A0A1V4SY15_9CLOT|nr:phage holin [Clostridium thermobutyricum]OPX49562.1 bacteriophage holin [Clostridium thermobutyricum DSM 4928]